MSCADTPTSFRLLDPWVGWQPQLPDGATPLAGLSDEGGLRLEVAGPAAGGLLRSELLPWFPDPRLASADRPGAWFLLADGGSGGRVTPRLLHRDPCTDLWEPVWTPWCDPALLSRPSALAAAAHRLAVVDGDAVLLWGRDGDQFLGSVKVPQAALVALTRRGEILVGTAGSSELRRFSPDGTPRRPARTGASGELLGIRVGPAGTIWVLSGREDGLELRSGRPDEGFRRAGPAELAAALPASGLLDAWDGGFCLQEIGPDAEPTERCWDWTGAPTAGRLRAPARYVREGQLRTELLDSGISRCRWHRVRLDAEQPVGSTLSVAVTVTENPDPAGVPSDDDWQQAAPGVLDFLVDQPPGRFLRLWLRLGGDGDVTPVVHRIRIDFPRSTSADLLPAAYRQDPVAEDFTERFLALFDASLEDLDRVVERYPALLDPDAVPDGVLTWLAGLLGLTFEAGWSPDVRRKLLVAAPELYRRRGTAWALSAALEIITGLTPTVTDLAAERRWATLAAPSSPSAVDAAAAGARLGLARLYGRASARVRLGAPSGAGGSVLGRAPLRAGGDPDADALTAHAFRFRVSLPPRAASPSDEQWLARLVARQAPAHTVATVHGGGLGLVVGVWSEVGVDTALVPLPSAVLGPVPAGVRSRPVRLGRSSVLAAGRKGPRTGTPLAIGTAVGVNTLAW